MLEFIWKLLINVLLNNLILDKVPKNLPYLVGHHYMLNYIEKKFKHRMYDEFIHGLLFIMQITEGNC